MIIAPCVKKCLRTRVILDVLGKLDKFSTLKSPLTTKEILLWGRWLELGFGWEKEVLKYSWYHKKKNGAWNFVGDLNRLRSSLAAGISTAMGEKPDFQMDS